MRPVYPFSSRVLHFQPSEGYQVAEEEQCHEGLDSKMNESFSMVEISS